MTAIDQYHEYVYDTPWGDMFYQLLWHQLDQSLAPAARILDFGSGFGKTAHHYAASHDVTAYEPDAQMLAQAEQGFEQLTGDFRVQLAGRRFDLILLHNVLEYVDAPHALLTELAQHLTADGYFSIVKHNALGHVFASAVLADAPAKALSEYQDGSFQSQSFGKMALYTEEALSDWLAPGQTIRHTYGLRTVFGLSANNEVKYTKAWREPMLALEQQLADSEAAKAVAFFHHVLTQPVASIGHG